MARAIRATRTAGLNIGRVEITKDGKIAIIPRDPAQAGERTAPETDAPAASELQPEPWD